MIAPFGAILERQGRIDRDEGRSERPERRMPSEVVRQVQVSLAALDFYEGPIDGSLGASSRKAIGLYQRSRGVRPTGVLTDAQLDALLRAAPAETAPVRVAEVGRRTTRPATDAAFNEPAPLGLVVRNGAVMAASESSSNWTALASPSLAALSRALLLKARPDLLDHADTTILFVSMLPKETDRAQYASTEFGYRWRGDNQFEVEDSRQAFLRDYRAALLALVPALPITVAEVRSAQLGSYDAASNALEIGIDRGGVWPHLSQINIDAPLPLSLPTVWTLPPADARRMVDVAGKADRMGIPLGEEGRKNPHPFVTALIRYRIKDVRPTKDGAALDLAALDIGIYAGRGLDRKLGEIPLPPDAVTDAPPVKAASDGLPVLDPLLPRLLVANLKPEIMQVPTFAGETFRLRREIERQVRRGAAITHWPLVVPNVLLTSNAAASPADVEATASWFAQTAKTKIETIEQPDICSYVGDGPNRRERCELREAGRTGSKVLLLKDFVGKSRADWTFASANNQWASEAAADAARKLPDNMGLKAISAGGDLPAMLAFAPSPHWIGLDIDFDPARLERAALELTIVKVSIEAYRQGEGYLLIQIAPLALRYTPQGGPETRIVFPETKPVQSVAGEPGGPATGRFDILGVKLGMPLDQAEAALRPNLEGEWARTDEERPTQALFRKAVAFRKDSDAIKIFYDPSRPDKPVVAIGRAVDLSSRAFADDAQAMAAVRPSMIAKFGQPHPASDQRELYWGVDPVTVAKMKAGLSYTDACSHNDYGNFRDRPDNSGRFGILPGFSAICGETLSSLTTRQMMRMLLINTDANALMEARFVAEAPRPVAPPSIKF